MPHGIKKCIRNCKNRLKKSFRNTFFGQKLSRNVKQIKMLKEKHIKPYLFHKIWLKCSLNITLLMLFGFGIIKKNSVLRNFRNFRLTQNRQQEQNNHFHHFTHIYIYIYIYVYIYIYIYNLYLYTCNSFRPETHTFVEELPISESVHFLILL